MGHSGVSNASKEGVKMKDRARTLAQILMPVCFIIGLAVGVMSNGGQDAPMGNTGSTPDLVFDISSHISIPALDSIIAIIEEDCCKVKAVTFSRAGTPELTITFVEKEGTE